MTFNEDLRNRTKKFAIDVISLIKDEHKGFEVKIVFNQLLRAATSVAANFRAATRARSKKEFYSKLSIVVEECDEVCFWLEIVNESKLLSNTKTDLLYKEAMELVKIFSSTRKKIREKYL